MHLKLKIGAKYVIANTFEYVTETTFLKYVTKNTFQLRLSRHPIMTK